MPVDSGDTIATPSIAYMEMADRWRMLHDLLGGTEAMRKAADKWLPWEPKEEAVAYNNRLERSFLYNGYGDAVTKIVSKPYAKPITLEGTTPPPPLDMIEEDVDMTGRDLTQFGRESLRAAVIYGLTHALVDFSSPSSEGRTRQDEITGRVRPVFIHVPPTNLIGWRTEKLPSGGVRLVEIRIRETRVELKPGALYTEHEQEYVRVYTPEEWFLYKKNMESGEFTVEQQSRHSFGEVPFFTFYTNRTGDYTAAPPLEDLAWMNIAHWQSLSDHRNILRFARVGLLFASGFTREEVDEGITIGPMRLINSTNPDAKLSYVEHTGKAMAIGETDLEKIEKRMESLGMQPFVQRPGNTTATGKAIDESKSHSLAQAWVRAQEDWILMLYRAGARWMNTEIADDFKANISNDFGIPLQTEADMKIIDSLNARGKLSDRTTLEEAKRRGVLSESVDIDDELDRADEDAGAGLPDPGPSDQIQQPEGEVPEEEIEQEEEAA